MCAMRTEPTTTAVSTGARVKGLIASHSSTRAKVAAALGISEPALGRRLRGEVPFNVDEVHTLATLFNTTVTRLLEEVA